VAHHFKYVIIGGGLAGASAIEGIRERDTSGSIALFGKEHHLPYDRPPLSKGLWLGKTTVEQLPVYEESFYKRHNVHLYLGVEIMQIDRQRRQVFDREENRYEYDKALIATGGAPRTLSFGGDAVHYYRTVDDYRKLREAVESYNEFILIGGGFIGAELAAALNLQGKEVTIIFPGVSILQKVFPKDLAAFVTDYYRQKGVKVIAEDVPTAVERVQGRTRVQTRNGKTLEADMAVAAIGLNLHTEMALRAGLKVENGIVVNEFLQTSDSHIFAAGDVAFFPVKSLGKKMRIEHWNNAQMQGRYAGGNMAGAQRPYDYLPYFYSDLFDLGFEAVGDLDSQHETFADWREPFREGVVYYLNGRKVVGVLLWNVWEKVDAARQLIEKKKEYANVQELKGRL
jgi:NADPH-dependent 2,4-dienoyl-CoA reductase/sulfur reductase-like enzyme